MPPWTKLSQKKRTLYVIFLLLDSLLNLTGKANRGNLWKWGLFSNLEFLTQDHFFCWFMIKIHWNMTKTDKYVKNWDFFFWFSMTSNLLLRSPKSHLHIQVLIDNLKISKDFQSLELLFFVSSDHYLSIDVCVNRGKCGLLCQKSPQK